MGRRSHVNRFQKACNRGRQCIYNAPKNVRTSIPQQGFLAKANLPSQPARRPNGGDPTTRRSASACLTPPRSRCKLGASGWVVFKYFSWKLFCAQRECALRPKQKMKYEKEKCFSRPIIFIFWYRDLETCVRPDPTTHFGLPFFGGRSDLNVF